LLASRDAALKFLVRSAMYSTDARQGRSPLSRLSAHAVEVVSCASPVHCWRCQVLAVTECTCRHCHLLTQVLLLLSRPATALLHMQG
jgi:hypothetical protein